MSAFDNDFMTAPIDDNGLCELSGVIEAVIFSNEDNGFAICDLGTENGGITTVAGIMPYIGKGDEVTVFGKWVHNPKYGRQFKVERAEKTLPADKASILRYLSSGAVKGIGKKTAQRIVDAFGDETFDVIENHPDWLSDVPGITKKRAAAIAQDFKNQAGIRTAMLFFREFFGAALTVRIYKKWGSSAVDLAKANPYRLSDEIEGIGFEKADRMAQAMGLAQNSEARISAGVKYVLSANAVQNGHVCLPREKAAATAATLLGVSAKEADDAISSLVGSHKICSVKFGNEQYLYDKFQYDSEKYVASKLILLDKVCPVTDTANIRSFIEKEEIESGVKYAEMQKKAISDALENGVMLLTGGPGTGKTTVVRALLHIFDQMGMKIALCAPTGRAAKRLSESTSCEAKTVHRLLEYSGGDDGAGLRFHRDENNLLEENVIIMDEASMADNLLMNALLRAVKPGARVIIIGDADQLPSVGAGNVLHDLLESERFATVRLTEIFRQAQKSLIITNAHAVNRGEMPRLDVKDNDFFFLKRESDEEIAATVADLCKNRLPRTYGETAITGTQVISPSRKGIIGTENLNVLLQRSINPPSEEKSEHLFRDTVFRVGDRVMQIRNNYDLEWKTAEGRVGSGVFNGDIGTVTAVHFGAKRLEIVFDEKIVSYEFNLLEELELAYAVTVHKSQGSEYPIVVIPLGSAAPMLLSRNMLYTAVTRAQFMVILVGREEILHTMVKNNSHSMRYTGLVRWLREEA